MFSTSSYVRTPPPFENGDLLEGTKKFLEGIDQTSSSYIVLPHCATLPCCPLSLSTDLVSERPFLLPPTFTVSHLEHETKAAPNYYQ